MSDDKSREAFTSESLARFRLNASKSSIGEILIGEIVTYLALKNPPWKKATTTNPSFPTGEAWYAAAGSASTAKMDPKSQELIKSYEAYAKPSLPEGHSVSAFVGTVFANLAKSGSADDEKTLKDALEKEAAKFKQRSEDAK
ncbi:hypothetical protein I204_01778 [Kwoniella mangroviensis CBS 8886]|uniref:uncharacterized protein n=1 Tax=Kwoniella mangroviensis CBS 8507 TaxID=1296122 RepID=UPI00080CFD49|nr:uncharacterized protein I203_03916 [Kwoniella mangroviensis CBS 8507]OCF67229.1 hypothetical protein I203_03916 [Kwoniella mangroviensis CBS 8507]OCF77777.1 hypothetical protein I204_01778 [Kwoniella mangroviensis CBS 8886]